MEVDTFISLFKKLGGRFGNFEFFSARGGGRPGESEAPGGGGSTFN